MFRVTLREFAYDQNEIINLERDKQQALVQSGQTKETLLTTCTESFKDLYSTYAHLKVNSHLRLKLIEDNEVSSQFSSNQ